MVMVLKMVVVLEVVMTCGKGDNVRSLNGRNGDGDGGDGVELWWL